MKISDHGATDAFGVGEMPCLVYFENGVPEIYGGDLLNDNAIMKWMMSELKQVNLPHISNEKSKSNLYGHPRPTDLISPF